jgi:cytochrome P450
MSSFADHYPPQVMADLLGLPEAEHERFVAWGKAIAPFSATKSRRSWPRSRRPWLVYTSRSTASPTSAATSRSKT